ncbi:MAG: MBL fold metallo-hydrolase [Methanospirillum sp.]|nr:MBL fold metallo-hydrolase [Methanospirillum sp.]
MMKISVLASGSKGNCVYIEGNSGALVIDAGRSAREILGTKDRDGRLAEGGGNREMIEAILVTHEHSDHVKGLAPLGNALKVPVYGTSGTLDAAIRSIHSKIRFPVHSVLCGDKISIGDFTVTPFPVSHDATDPCGYLIEEDSVRVCYCTDTGIVTESMRDRLREADGVILESNHCPKMLRDGPYPEFLKRRIASPRGHLSNKDTGTVLKDLAGSLHCAVLAHLSEENNEPDLALRNAHEALGIHADEVEIFVASSVDLVKKPPCRKERQKCRATCLNECWKIPISL